MRLRSPFLLLLLAGAALPAAADEAPACLPSGAVLADAEIHMGAWLVKAGADEVKRHLEKVNRGGSWERGTLVMSCGLQGRARKMDVVSVKNGGEGVPEAGDARALASLAARTGHTKQEADVLARRYAQLAGAFFRQLRDEDGTQRSERELILRKHERRAGGDPDAEEDGGVEELDEASAAEVERRIDAAEARGDTAEVLRLVTQAKQGMAAPAAAREKGAQLEQRRWRVLESAYAELAQAAYRTSIVFHHCPCTQCRLPY